jgi:hypothetical protein
VNHDIPGGTDQGIIQANRFTGAAADPVSNDGFADRLGDSEADTRVSGTAGVLIVEEKRGQQTARVAGAVVVDPPKIDSLQEPAGLREIEHRRSGLCESHRELGGRLGIANGWFVADGQLPAAFGATAGQNGLPILSFHAGTETVCFGAFAVIRLKCSLWHLMDFAPADQPLQGAFMDRTLGSPIFQYRGWVGGCQIEVVSPSIMSAKT